MSWVTELYHFGLIEFSEKMTRYFNYLLRFFSTEIDILQPYLRRKISRPVTANDYFVGRIILKERMMGHQLTDSLISFTKKIIVLIFWTLEFSQCQVSRETPETSSWGTAMANTYHLSCLPSHQCLWQTLLTDHSTQGAQIWSGIHFSRVHRQPFPNDRSET